MKDFKIITEQGWTEAIIASNCGFDKFYSAAKILENTFDVNFINKLDGLDSLYWDFIIDKKRLTLHFDTFAGVSIFPTNLKDATDEENAAILDIGKNLFDQT